MQRNNFKIKLKKSNGQFISSAECSFLTRDRGIEYIFDEEKLAQDALRKFNVSGAGIVDIRDEKHTTFKIKLTSEQFGDKDYKILTQVNAMRRVVGQLSEKLFTYEPKANKHKERTESKDEKEPLIEILLHLEKLILAHPHLIADLVLLRKDSKFLYESFSLFSMLFFNFYSLKGTVSATCFLLLKNIIKVIDSDTLCYLLFCGCALDESPFTTLLDIAKTDEDLDSRTQASELVSLCIDKMDTSIINYLLNVQDQEVGEDVLEGEELGFAYLSNNTTQADFTKIIRKSSDEVVCRSLLWCAQKNGLEKFPKFLIPICLDQISQELTDALFQIQTRKLSGLEYLAQQTDSVFFIPLVNKASQSVIDKILPELDRVTLYLLLHQHSQVLIAILEKSSTKVLYALMQQASLGGSKSVFSSLVETLDSEIIFKLLKRLGPAYIQNLIETINIRSLKNKALNALVLEKEEEKKAIESKEEKIEEETSESKKFLGSLLTKLPTIPTPKFNLKIQLKTSNGQPVLGLKHSYLIEGEGIEYGFENEEAAQDALIIFKTASIIKDVDASKKKFIIKIPSEQVGMDDFKKLTIVNSLYIEIRKLCDQIFVSGSELQLPKEKEGFIREKETLIHRLNQLYEMFLSSKHLLSDFLLLGSKEKMCLFVTLFFNFMSHNGTFSTGGISFSSISFLLLKHIFKEARPDFICYVLLTGPLIGNFFSLLLRKAQPRKTALVNEQSRELVSLVTEKISFDLINTRQSILFQYLSDTLSTEHFTKIVKNTSGAVVSKCLLSYVKTNGIYKFPRFFIPICFEKMSLTLVDYIFQLNVKVKIKKSEEDKKNEEEGALSGLVFLSQNTDHAVFISLIDISSSSVIDTTLLQRIKLTGTIAFMELACHHERTFIKIIQKASKKAIDQALIAQSSPKQGEKNGLQYVLQNVPTAFVHIVEKASLEALKIALIQRNNEDESGFYFAVNTLDLNILSQLFYVLDQDCIDDLIATLPQAKRGLQNKVRKALSLIRREEKKEEKIESKEEKTEEKEEKKPVPLGPLSEKSVETLLSEIKAINIANPHIQEIIETIKNQLALSREAYKSKAGWSALDCNKWAKEMKSSTHPHLPEMVAVLCRGVELHAGYLPRNIQLLSLFILLLASDKGKLAQIDTGEGKATLIAMFAIIKVFLGKRPDIITSSSVLAEQGFRNNAPLYEMFDITVAHNGNRKHYGEEELQGPRKKPIDCYKADVVYGGIDAYLWDLIKENYLDLGGRNGRPYQLAIVDEVDSMLIDKSGHTSRMSSQKPYMEFLELLLIATWQKLLRIEETFKREEKLASVDEKWIDRTSSKKNNLIKSLLKKYLIALISDEKSVVYVPKHLKEFALYQADTWAENALIARQMVQGKDYVLTWNEEEKAHIISPVDFANTGVIERGVVLSGGLHQFLQIKHNLKIQAENLVSYYVSILAFFYRYESHIYGLTGTLGSKQNQMLLQHAYSIDVVFIPPFRPKRFMEVPGILVDDHKSLVKIVTARIAEEVCKKRGALIICESINDVDEIESSLASLIGSKSKIKRYTDSETEEGAVSELMEAGEIIIATNLAGRGTDIRTSRTIEENGGLFVCVCFLPENQRVEDQAFGRTSRTGNIGTAQLIVNKEKTIPKLSQYCADLMDIETISGLKKLRDKKEAARLKLVKEFVIGKIILFENLLYKFLQLKKTLLTIKKDKTKIDEVEDRWAFWLLKLENKIQSEKRFDERVISENFNRFAEAITKDYQEEELKDSGLHILKGKEFGLGTPQSVENYTKAIDFDQITSVQAYYNRAFSLIQANHSDYKTKAIEDLTKAKHGLEENIIPRLQVMQVISGLSLEEKKLETDLIKQAQVKIEIYKNQIRNIDYAIKILSSPYPVALSNWHPVRKLFKDNMSDKDMLEVTRSGLSHFFELQEIIPPPPQLDEEGGKKKRRGLRKILHTVKRIFHPIPYIALGVAQIIAGVCLSYIPIVGQALVSEGIGDIVWAARSTLEGNCNWSNYRAHKITNMAVSVIAMGVESIIAEVTAAASSVGTTAAKGAATSSVVPSLTREQFTKVATERVTKALVTSGIKEVVGFSLGKVARHAIKNFKPDIEREVRQEVLRLFSQSEIILALNTLLAADIRSGSYYYTNRIRHAIYDIVHSKQSMHRLSTNILRGVLARQHTLISAAIKLSEISGALDKIMHLTREVCGDFAGYVKMLAYSLPVPGSDHAGSRNQLSVYIVEMVTRTIMSILNGQIVRPITDTVVSYQVDKLATEREEIKVRTSRSAKTHAATQHTTKHEGVGASPATVPVKGSSGFRRTNAMPSVSATRSKDRQQARVLRHPSRAVTSRSLFSNLNGASGKQDDHFLSDSRTKFSERFSAGPAYKKTLVEETHHTYFKFSEEHRWDNPFRINSSLYGIKNTNTPLCYSAWPSMPQLSYSAYPMPIYPENNKGLDYIYPIVSGIHKGASSTYYAFTHPFDEIIYPTAQFIYDTLVIADTYYPLSDMVSFQHGLSKHVLYDGPRNRMENRIQDARIGLRYFMNASGPERAEILAAITTSTLIPGSIFKGVSIAARAPNYYKNFGTFLEPPLFHDCIPDFNKAQKPKKIFSISDVRNSTTELQLLYVITEEKKLIIAPKKTDPFWRNDHEQTVIHHPDLSNLRPVYGAGEVYINDGSIRRIDNFSGHFLPDSPMLENVVTHIFKKNGYVEAAGKFHNLFIFPSTIELEPITTYRHSRWTPFIFGLSEGLIKSLNSDVPSKGP